MSKELRIVFMGTPDFAVAILKTLIANSYTVVGVITAPDKPAGRGRKLNESAVKQYAKTQGLNILQPTNLKSEAFLETLKALNANLQIVVAFRMLPEVVWKMPEHGTFNLHASLLPNYRGAAPINWAIINGETTSGVSTFFIDDKIDTGDTILQKEVSITLNENAGVLHDKLMNLGCELVIETVKRIEDNSVNPIPQPNIKNIKTAYKLNRDNCKIDWNDPIHTIYNKIRGLSPYPAAWSQLENNGELLDVKIYDAKIELENHSYNNGTIISSKKELKVAVPKGYILIKNIKLPGKRSMDIEALLNGYLFSSDSKML